MERAEPRPPKGGEASRPGRARAAALRFTAALLLLATGLAGGLLWQGYASVIADAEARARGAAQVAATHIHWLTEATLQALQRIDESLGPVPGAGLAAGDFDRAVAGLPEGTAAWAFDAEGEPLLTNDPQPLSFRPLHLRLFAELAAGRPWQISRLVTLRSTGEQGFLIGRRIERDGAFAGVAMIVFPASMLGAFWQGLELGAGSSLGLIRDDGWLVVRYPVPQAALDLSGYRLFTEELPKSPVGLYHAAASPADGAARIVAYRRVEGLPLVAVAGLSKTDVVLRFWTQAGWLLALALPIKLALIYFVRRLARLLSDDEALRRRLAGALTENHRLFDELHHRVKNNLQVVSSVVSLWPGEAAAKQETLRRIAAMGLLHQQIYESNRLGSVDLQAYLERVALALAEIYGSVAEIRFRGDRIEVGAEAAQPLGLIACEAISNAYKHAFSPGRQGRIEVTLKRLEEGRALLVIADDGRGRATGALPGSGGLGQRLIQGLAEQIGASVTYRSGAGTALEVAFPVA